MNGRPLRRLRCRVFSFELSKADQALLLHVPNRQKHRLETRRNRDFEYVVELRILVVDLFQTIIGDSRRQMVNVVEADVAREPLQKFRQFVERTSLHRSADEAPFVIGFPIGMLELMLNVEKPNSRARRDVEHRKRDFQKRNPTDPQSNQRKRRRHRHVCDPDVAFVTRAVLHRICPVTVDIEEQHQRPKEQEHKRIAIRAIAQALYFGELQILINSENIHVAVSAMIQISIRRVMQRVLAFPIEIGHHRKQTARVAQTVIPFSAGKERHVAAVMLNNEQANREARREQRETQREPIGIRKAQVHQVIRSEQRQKCVEGLPERYFD